MQGVRMSIYLTLGEAAKQTGKSKTALSLAIKEGRLSVAEKTERGYKIDPAELFRVYPPKPLNEVKENHNLTLENSEHNTFLLQKIAYLEETIADMKGERDHAREREQIAAAEAAARIKDMTEIIARQNLALTAPKVEAKAPEPVKRKKFLGVF